MRNAFVLAALTSLVLGGCIRLPDQGAPEPSSRAMDPDQGFWRASAVGCASANVHSYYPREEVQARLPPGFRATAYVPTGPAPLGFVGAIIMSCESASFAAQRFFWAEVSALVDPPHTNPIVNATGTGDRKPHDASGLALDFFAIGVYTDNEELARRFSSAGVPVVKGSVEFSFQPSLSAATVTTRLFASGDPRPHLTYAAEAPVTPYGNVSTRVWHVSNGTLDLFERFAPKPMYAFPGVQACALSPDSPIAAWLARAACQPVQASAVAEADWSGVWLRFSAQTLETQPQVST